MVVPFGVEAHRCSVALPRFTGLDGFPVENSSPASTDDADGRVGLRRSDLTSINARTHRIIPLHTGHRSERRPRRHERYDIDPTLRAGHLLPNAQVLTSGSARRVRRSGLGVGRCGVAGIAEIGHARLSRPGADRLLTPASLAVVSQPSPRRSCCSAGRVPGGSAAYVLHRSRRSAPRLA